MKLFELLAFNKEILGRLEASGVKPADYKYVPLYADYLAMRNAGEKVTYIVAALAEKYQVSERKAYYLIERLGQEIDCNKIARQK